MKKFGILFLLLFLTLVVTSSAAEKFMKVDRDFTIPSFVGYVQNQLIVVLNDDVSVDHARDVRSQRALSNYSGFDPLAQRFAVADSRPQFAGADRKAGAQQLARHYKVTIGKGTIEEAKAAYERNPQVKRVELIGLHTTYATPNDTYYDNPPAEFPYDQWHYWANHSVDADLAWDLNSGSETVLVGILDSGTRYFHIDLGGNSTQWGPGAPFAGGNIFINPNETPGDGVDNDGNGYVDDVIGYDFIETTGGIGGVSCIDQDCGTKDNDPDDGNGHGTHTAGTVGAITNNARQVAGVAGGFSDGTTSGVGNGVKIVPCRMGYHASYRGMVTGIVDMAAAAEAMYYMADLVDAGHNVAAINCSWGSSNSGGLGAAADYLISRDVVIVVAAGNSNSTSASYLGTRGDCLDVAATDKNGNGASFTNYGSWVDVAAPGVEILSTYRNPDDSDPAAHYIALLDGTSMSAPHVVGIVALLESCNPALTAADKFNLVVGNTTPYSDSRDLGSGIANAYLALQAANCSSTCTETTPVADFSGSPTSGDAPLLVAFTDLSTNNPSSWSWDFGDGGTSTAQNPSYTYDVAGTYTVSLTASNCAGSNIVTKTGYITVSEPPCTETIPVADFSGSPTSGDAPLTVTFTDLSTNNPSSWSWDFGDGGTSTAQNPSYTYSAAGTYTVALTAGNCAGSNTVTKTDYITVTQSQQQEMHVQNITLTRQAAGGPNRVAVATVTVYDQAGLPVSGATVYGVFNAPNTSTKTGVTNSSGIATIQSDKTRTPPADWCFEVTDITATGYVYNSTANLVIYACESGWVYKIGNPTILPTEMALSNHPNPFNPTTTIGFALTQDTHARLDIFNIAGQKVATLVDEYLTAGEYSVEWDGRHVASGIYLYRLSTLESSQTKKMVLMK